MSPRLSLAVDPGRLHLPDGPILVMHPRADADLSALLRDNVTIMQPFYTDHAAWQARGYHCVTQSQGQFATVIVFLPRAKVLARALLAQAVGLADLVIVDGLKTDGVDSILKDVRKRIAVEGPVVKAHGKLFWFTAEGGFDDWAITQGQADGFVTAPGVFSADGIDPASALLAQVLPAQLGALVVDLGAGWGYLSAQVVTRDTVELLHVVEADCVALNCARTNLPDPRARFHWADATTWQPDEPVDTVVMNPPFHSGRAADIELGRAFIASAAQMLKASGTLWMVANRHLPYESALRSAFREVDELAGESRFKLVKAARPSRPRR